MPQKRSGAPAPIGELPENLPTVASIDLTATGFLRLPQVLAIFPVCRATWWDGVRSGKFPAAYRLSERSVGWRASDIAALVANAPKVSKADVAERV